MLTKVVVKEPHPNVIESSSSESEEKANLSESEASKRTPQRNLPFKDQDRINEVNKTLDRIESGGPHPYSKDETVFQNREGKLPQGNYREYTVETPGAPNRAERRVVVDQNTG
ncbi:MAG: hypothetical protein GY768_08530, partial [Planctomycetaceae bacterium]|nr:hypothetical protein [Planctomycetaceae bacterium]